MTLLKAPHYVFWREMVLVCGGSVVVVAVITGLDSSRWLSWCIRLWLHSLPLPALVFLGGVYASLTGTDCLEFV
jgi:hypothetical protein